MYTIKKNFNGEIVFNGDKKELVKWISDNYKGCNIGERTSLWQLAQIIQVNYNLFKNEKRIYSM